MIIFNDRISKIISEIKFYRILDLFCLIQTDPQLIEGDSKPRKAEFIIGDSMDTT